MASHAPENISSCWGFVVCLFSCHESVQFFVGNTKTVLPLSIKHFLKFFLFWGKKCVKLKQMHTRLPSSDE